MSNTVYYIRYKSGLTMVGEILGETGKKANRMITIKQPMEVIEETVLDEKAGSKHDMVHLRRTCMYLKDKILEVAKNDILYMSECSEELVNLYKEELSLPFGVEKVGRDSTTKSSQQNEDINNDEDEMIALGDALGGFGLGGFVPPTLSKSGQSNVNINIPGPIFNNMLLMLSLIGQGPMKAMGQHPMGEQMGEEEEDEFGLFDSGDHRENETQRDDDYGPNFKDWPLDNKDWF